MKQDDIFIRGDLPEFNNPDVSREIDLGKYMIAIEVWEDGKKLPQYILCTKDNYLIHLGIIKWYGAWRKFCWFTDGIFDDIVFDSKCLNDIERFLDTLNEMHKKGEFN